MQNTSRADREGGQRHTVWVLHANLRGRNLVLQICGKYYRILSREVIGQIWIFTKKKKKAKEGKSACLYTVGVRPNQAPRSPSLKFSLNILRVVTINGSSVQTQQYQNHTWSQKWNCTKTYRALGNVTLNKSYNISYNYLCKTSGARKCLIYKSL